MTSKQALTELFNEANRLSMEKSKYTTADLWQMCKQIQDDLELLDSLLNVFKEDILEAFNPYYIDGDNIVTECLIKQLGMVTLKKLKERINKNDK